MQVLKFISDVVYTLTDLEVREKTLASSRSIEQSDSESKLSPVRSPRSRLSSHSSPGPSSFLPLSPKSESSESPTIMATYSVEDTDVLYSV